MAARKKGYKAWLVRWEWSGEHAAVERPIIAVLPPQTDEADIRRFVERYYMATQYDDTELLLYMRQPRSNPYRAQLGTTTVVLEDGKRSSVPYGGEVVCGHNPYIVAALVDGLRVAGGGADTTLKWNDGIKPILDLRATHVDEDGGSSTR